MNNPYATPKSDLGTDNAFRWRLLIALVVVSIIPNFIAVIFFLRDKTISPGLAGFWLVSCILIILGWRIHFVRTFVGLAALFLTIVFLSLEFTGVTPPKGSPKEALGWASFVFEFAFLVSSLYLIFPLPRRRRWQR